jgi:hypothetical protein
MSSIISKSMIDNYIKFIENHKQHFRYYDSVKDVPNLYILNWLYLFIAKCYDRDVSKVFDKLTYKLGETESFIDSRMKTYNKKVNPTKIECIHCTLPVEREKLIKAFLNNRTNIRPSIGKEYFTECRDLIKILILIMVHTSDQEIIRYEKFYGEKNMKEMELFFVKIELILKKISENDDFELKIEKNLCENEIELKQHICQYCNTECISVSNLNHHQKTAKFCLEIQKKEDETKKHSKLFNCEYCNKEFTVKYNYNVHLNSCKERKAQDANKLNNRVKELELDLEKAKKEIEKINKEKDELKLKLTFERKNVERLEKDNKRLTKFVKIPMISTSTETSQENNKTNYNIQFNQILNSINVMNKNNIDHTMKTIRSEVFENYNLLDIKNEISNTLSNVIIQFMFYTDASRKIVVVKKEDNSAERMKLDDFLIKYFDLGKQDINDYLDTFKIVVYERVNNDIMSEEDFDKFKVSFEELKASISNVDKYTLKSNNLLKLITKNVIKKSRKLYKNTSTTEPVVLTLETEEE